MRLIQSVFTDVVILDLANEKGNDLDVLKSIRALSDVPVISWVSKVMRKSG